MIWLNESEWERADVWEEYSEYDFPYINLGAELDVTKLYYLVKENQLSFYMATIYCVTRAALEIKNFRYRIVDGKPALCEKLTPVFPYIPEGEEEFYLVAAEYQEDMETFCRTAYALAQEPPQRKKNKYVIGAEEVEVLSITCIPWVHYTHFIRTIKEEGKDNVPRISWGKFQEQQEGKITMPFSVQVHHGLMDGYHVGKYFMILEDLLADIKL